jgi:hypothetical protein
MKFRSLPVLLGKRGLKTLWRDRAGMSRIA